MAKALTLRQRLFVHHYHNEAEGNAVDAAQCAGYASPEANAYRLLRLRTVQAALAAQVEEAGFNRAEILSRWAEHANASIEDFVSFRPSLDPEG